MLFLQNYLPLHGRMFSAVKWKGLNININGKYITHLRFAEDIVIIAETLEDLSTMLKDLSRASIRVGLWTMVWACGL